jgi:flavodoxin
MRICVLYFSRTGNTKRMAEAISDSTKAPAFDIASSEPLVVENYDLLILGTPVEGSKPAMEVLAFIERLPKAEGKKVILFCTYAMWKGSTFKVLTKELASKGYDTILNVSKKGVKPNEPADFSDILYEIRKMLEK